MGAITVGQVEALFRLRDEMSAQLKGIQGETKRTGDAFSGLSGAAFVFNNIRDAASSVFGVFKSAAGAVVDTLRDWVGGLIQSGGALSDMSAKTGTSVEFLQKLGHALELNGSTLEAGTKAIGLMQKAIVAGDADFGKLGLRVSELRAMKPEEAFMATANAIAAIKNPTEQAAAAMGVFGKSGAELLPALKNGLAGVMQQAEDLGFVMSSQTAAAADQLGDSVDTLSATWEGLKNNVAAVIVENASLHAFIEKGTEILGRWSKAINQNKGDLGSLVSDGVIGFANALVRLLEIGIQVNDWLDAMHELWRGTAIVALTAAEAIIKTAIAIGYATGAADEVMSKYDADLNSVQKSIAEYGKESQKAADDNIKWANTLIAAQSGLKEMAAAAEAAKGKTLELAGAVKTGDQALNDGVVVSAGKRAELLQKVLDLEKEKWADAQKENLHVALESLKKIEEADKEYYESKARHAAGVRDVILQAQADEIEAAQVAAEKSADAWASVGSFASDVMRLFESVGLESFASIAGQAVDTAGMLEQAAKQGYISWAQLGQQIVGIVKNASVAGGALSGAMTGFAIGGPVGAGIGALAGGLLGLFGKAKQAREEMKKLSDQFVQSMGGMAALTAKAKEAGVSLDAMFKAKNAQQLKTAIDQIKGALDSWAEAQEKTKAAAEEYGFTIGEMGDRWAAQKLEERAASLLEKYKLLTAAGFDHDAILARMGPDFGKYVDEALAAGQSIPESMREIIDQLFAQGKLLHENGDAYTQAEKDGLTYTKTMSEQFAGLMEQIERLVAALTRGINVPVNFQYNTDGAPSHGGGSHEPGYHGGEGYDVGGLSSGPASGHMEQLHGDEYVVPRKQTFLRQLGQEVAAAMGGGWGAGRPETIVTNVGVHVQSNQIAMAQSTAERRREGRRPRA